MLVPSNLVRISGAGNETRTRDPNLGKVVLYQLSYSRRETCYCSVRRPPVKRLRSSPGPCPAVRKSPVTRHLRLFDPPHRYQ